MTTDTFTPHVRIKRRSKAPHPILPVGNYGYWLQFDLPDDAADLRFEQLILIAGSIWAKQPQDKFWGPFGDVTGYELRPTLGVSYHLNESFAFEPNRDRSLEKCYE